MFIRLNFKSLHSLVGSWEVSCEHHIEIPKQLQLEV